MHPLMLNLLRNGDKLQLEGSNVLNSESGIAQYSVNHLYGVKSSRAASPGNRGISHYWSTFWSHRSFAAATICDSQECNPEYYTGNPFYDCWFIKLLEA
jgi:hypothetical protein